MGMLLEKESVLLSSSFYSMALRRIKDEFCQPGGSSTLVPTVVCKEITVMTMLKDCLQSGGKQSFCGKAILGEDGSNATNAQPMAQYIFGVADLPPADLPEELPAVAIQMFFTVAAPEPATSF
eukprot:405585_1